MATLQIGHSPPAMYPPSRIPKMKNNTDRTPHRPSLLAKANGSSYQRVSHNNHLSPLQKLQQDYQEKLQLEKEKKMTSIYQKWSEEALKRVEQHSGNRSHINHNESKQKKADGYTAIHQRRSTISAQQRMRQRKPQKLPPLNNISKAQSFHTQQAPPEKVKHQRHAHFADITEQQNGFSDTVDSNKEDDGNISPPPNIQHLRLLRERKLQHRRIMQANNHENMSLNGHQERTKRKMTDFEKWQQEQDTDRMKRLQAHYTQQNNLNPVKDGVTLSDTIPYEPQKRSKRLKNINPVPASNTIKTKPLISPAIHNQTNENARRIAELEKQMRQKQMDLRRMKNQERRSRLDSSGNGTSGSENESDHELLSSTSHTPILKPVRVSTKKYTQSNHSIFSDEDNSSSSAFQMKPVLVRRDQSRESSRSTPKNNKTYMTQKHKTKQNLRNLAMISPDLPINEEPNKNSISPPLLVNENSERAQPHSQYSLSQIKDDEENVVLKLYPCKSCGRKFTKDRLAKHTKVCTKVQNKSRKVFDMTKVRTEGTEAEKYAKRKSDSRSPVIPPRKKVNWRHRHEEFIKTIRNAKALSQHVAKGGKYSDLPPPEPSDNPDYIKCQYCERKFNPAVAERHIPRCKDIKSRPKPPPRR